MVPDHQLSRVEGWITSGPAWPVSAVNTSGAGGLIALARRHWTRLAIDSAESAVRDLDDLAGGAARVVAAATDLDPEVTLFVELPYAPGWQRAVEVVEASGHLAKLALGGVDAGVAAEQLSMLVEADMAFKISGLADERLLRVLVAVAALVDGAEPAEAAERLVAGQDAAARAITGWDHQVGERVRRRLQRWDSPDPDALRTQLRAAGLLPIAVSGA